MNLDLNTVWSRGMRLVRDNFQLLFVIAGIFLLLPTIAVYVLIPEFHTIVDPAADPEQVAERMGEFIGPLLGVGGLLAAAQFVGHGAMIALIGPGRPTVGQALEIGFRILPSTVAVMILFLIAYFIGAVAILLPVSILAGMAGSSAMAVIALIPVLAFVVWLMARLSMSMPVLVLGGTRNPVTAMTTSFRLTGPRQWQVLMFWAVLLIAMIVISLLFSGVIGVVAALAASTTTAMLIAGVTSGLTSVASGIVTCGVAVAMYEQLSGPSIGAIADTFE